MEILGCTSFLSRFGGFTHSQDLINIDKYKDIFDHNIFTTQDLYLIFTLCEYICTNVAFKNIPSHTMFAFWSKVLALDAHSNSLEIVSYSGMDFWIHIRWAFSMQDLSQSLQKILTNLPALLRVESDLDSQRKVTGVLK